MRADILDDREVREILERLAHYIDSSKYFSWERFFTALLIEKTQNSYLRYSKNRLGKAYLTGKVFEKIRRSLPKGLLEDETRVKRDGSV